MFSNLKSKKRITQLLIAVLVIAITVTGSAFLLGDFVRKASAETYKVTVNSVAEWNAAVGNAATDIEITLGADIASTTNYQDNETPYKGLELAPIPSGKNVTVNMNNHKIQWDDIREGEKWGISLSYPLHDVYWGMITNQGTLTLTGTGTVSQYHIRYNNENGNDRDNYGSKSAAIVNEGILNIGSGITVENFLAQANTEGNNFQDMFIYSHGIYNTGTVNTSGTIQSGAFAMGVTDGTGGRASYATAYSYGIFGGIVNVNGGNIYSEAKSGGNKTGNANKVDVWNFAVGVYSNNAKILGNSSITTKATNWAGSGSSNLWGSTTNMSWSVGAMYSDTAGNGANAPVIGPDVNVSSSYYNVKTGDKESVKFPELNSKSSIIDYSCRSAGKPKSFGRIAYSVAGVPIEMNAAMYGGQTAEVNPIDGKVFGVNEKGSPNTSYYKTELYNNGGTTTLTTSTDNQSTFSGNANELKTSTMTMGGSGTTGGQFVVYYRYWDAAGSKVVKATKAADESINAPIRFNIDTGAFTTDGTVLSQTSGGEVKNSKYYQFLGTFSRVYQDGAYGNGIDLSSNAVNTKGAQFDTANALSLKAARSYVIWVDYQALNPTYVKVVAENKGTPVNSATKSTSFSTTYTGAPIVPGQDFNLGIIDMRYDLSVEIDEVSDNTDVTSSYAIKGVDEEGKVLVKYEYSADGGSTYTNGLPKDVGKYKIKVTVPEDRDITKAGSGNRYGATTVLDCEIKQGVPVIDGPANQNGTYGDTIASIIPVDKYTVKDESGKVLTGGSWSYTGYANTDIPEAGSKNINLVWTPKTEDAANFKSTSFTVTINVAKRDSKVTPADSTIVYGTAAPKFTVNCTNIADIDKANLESWVNNSEFEVFYNDSWQAYSSTMTPGVYDIRIKTFGGSASNNYNFDVSSSDTAKLTITKAPLNYNAVATDRTYNGTDTVDVKLTYVSGAVNGDTISNTLNTTGKLENVNAGSAKKVNVNTDIEFASSSNYVISINGSVTVNIGKATPTVSITPIDRTYDSTVKLSDITINGTAKGINDTTIDGTWAWVNADTVPSASVKSYKVKFTPNDTTNYADVTVDATVNVSKKKVTITAEDKNITFGDPSPALTLKYDGFTGADNINSISTTGSISTSTDYSKGSNAGTYPIKITVTDYESENYQFETVNGTVNVSKRNITVKPNDDKITFGDTKPSYDVSDIKIVNGELYGSDTLASLNSDAKFSVTTDYAQTLEGGSVGTYVITVSASDTTNYKFSTEKAILTVEKATLTVKADNKNITYLDNAPETESYTCNISGYKYNAESEKDDIQGKPGFSTKYTKGDVVGSYGIEINAGTLSHKNYNFSFEDGALIVGKYKLDTSSVDISATVSHDELYSSAVFGNSFNDGNVNVNGTFALNESNKKADYTTAYVVAGQSYRTVTAKATFTPVDTANYETVEIDVTLRINPHAITGAPVIKGSPVEGQQISVSVATMTPSSEDSYTYQWYVDGSKVTGETGTTYTIKTSDIDKNIYVEVTAKTENGYTGVKISPVVKAVKGFSKFVTKDELSVSGIGEFTFNGNTFAATVTPKSEFIANGYVSNNITVYYNGSTELPRNAGTYKVTVDVGTPDVADESTRNDYYGPVSGLEVGTITIKKANVTATITVDDKTYDGTVKVNNYKADLENKNNISLDSELASVTFADAAAGSNKTIVAKGFKLAGSDANNYELVVKTNEPTINRKELLVSVQGVTREYNKSAAIGLTVSIDNSSYASVDSSATVSVYSASATSLSANAGTHFIKDIAVELTGSSKDNYTVVVTNKETAQVTITQATPNPDAVTVSGLVYDANRTLASVTIPQPTDGTWSFVDTTIVPTVNQVTYSATFVPNDSNYKAYNGYVTVNVTPKDVTIKAEDKTVVYGKSVAYTFVASGFTGSDSLDTMGGTKPTCQSDYYVGMPVGDYDINIVHNLDSNGNYNFIVVKGKLNVTPATIYATATAVDRDYNGTDSVDVNFSITSGIYGSDDVNISKTSDVGVAASANAGTRVVTYVAPTLVGEKASNYKLVLTPATGVLTVKINKIDPAGVVFPTSAEVEFSRDLSTTVFTDGSGENGSFEFVNKTLPDSLGVHVREIMFVPTDTVNYNNLYSNINLNVKKCVLNYVVSIGGTEQVGQKLTASVTGMPAMANNYIHYQWFRLDSNGEFIRINTANDSTYTLVDQDKGYTICVMTYFDDNAPYLFEEGVAETVDEITGILGVTINTVKEENLSFWQRLIKWIQSIIDAITGISWAM